MGAAGLDRFVDAQADTYHGALAELRAGTKQGHWMWFIFPQIAGLGRSPTARRYALADAGEARAYGAHPVLGPRLLVCCEALLGWAGRRSAVTMLGPVDAMKLRSSMTLFAKAAQNVPTPFTAVLDAFYESAYDPLTLNLLGGREPDGD